MITLAAAVSAVMAPRDVLVVSEPRCSKAVPGEIKIGILYDVSGKK